MNDKKKVLTTLEKLEKAIEQIMAAMATKNDLKRFTTKDDLNGLATKDDLNEFATKNDLKNFATKDDLNQFATKDDLNRFATKDDLNQFATKDDLKKELSKYATKDDLYAMRELITEDITDVIKGFVEVIDERKADKEDVNRLEKRVKRLEELPAT